MMKECTYTYLLSSCALFLNGAAHISVIFKDNYRLIGKI